MEKPTELEIERCVAREIARELLLWTDGEARTSAVNAMTKRVREVVRKRMMAEYESAAARGGQ